MPWSVCAALKFKSQCVCMCSASVSSFVMNMYMYVCSAVRRGSRVAMLVQSMATASSSGLGTNISDPSIRRRISQKCELAEKLSSDHIAIVRSKLDCMSSGNYVLIY